WSRYQPWSSMPRAGATAQGGLESPTRWVAIPSTSSGPRPASSSAARIASQASVVVLTPESLLKGVYPTPATAAASRRVPPTATASFLTPGAAPVPLGRARCRGAERPATTQYQATAWCQEVAPVTRRGKPGTVMNQASAWVKAAAAAPDELGPAQEGRRPCLPATPDARTAPSWRPRPPGPPRSTAPTAPPHPGAARPPGPRS